MDPITQQAVLATAGAAAGGPGLSVDDVFSTDLWEGSSSQADVENGIDLSTEGGLVWIKNRSYSAGRSHVIYDTERGANKVLSSNSDSGESTYAANGTLSFNTDGYDVPSGDGDINGNGFGKYCGWTFRKAPGFFDVVAYTGTGANQAVNHNLGVTPEFVIIKNRDSGDNADWTCWHKDLTSTNPYIFLNSDAAEGPFGGVWINPSSTGLNLGSATSHTYYNDNNVSYISYLFATLPYISKVGSYTGTGNNIDINCGFTAGARFVMIKRTDSTGDWYVWDTARGIVSGDDPYLLLNSTAVEVTNTDYIDPLTSGFTVTSSAPAALNASGGTYIFLAIA